MKLKLHCISFHAQAAANPKEMAKAVNEWMGRVDSDIGKVVLATQGYNRDGLPTVLSILYEPNEAKHNNLVDVSTREVPTLEPEQPTLNTCEQPEPELPHVSGSKTKSLSEAFSDIGKERP